MKAKVTQQSPQAPATVAEVARIIADTATWKPLVASAPISAAALTFVRPETNDDDRAPAILLAPELPRPVEAMDARRAPSTEGASSAMDAGCTRPLAAGCAGSNAAGCGASTSGRCAVRTIAATAAESCNPDDRRQPLRVLARLRALVVVVVRVGAAARRSAARGRSFPSACMCCSW